MKTKLKERKNDNRFPICLFAMKKINTSVFVFLPPIDKMEFVFCYPFLFFSFLFAGVGGETKTGFLTHNLLPFIDALGRNKLGLRTRIV